jgi:hypothetical protein
MHWLRYLALISATIAIGAAADQPANDTSQKTNSRPRVRLGGITIGAGYSHFSGRPYPYYAGYPFGWGYPYFYGPFLFTPYAYPGFYTGYGYGPGMGELKLQTADRTAWVYLDGALAGRADKLKTMWLEPGAYNLEVRSGDRKFAQRVYVLSGKTLKLNATRMDLEIRP